MKIKKGDKVKVIAGDQRNETGVVLQVLPKDNKVIVEGINVVKKHLKPSQVNPEGGIIEKEAPIHVSNVAIVNPKTKTGNRVGYTFEKDQKVRVARKAGKDTKLDK